MRIFYLLVFWLGFMPLGFSAEIEVSSDTNSVIQGESFNLNFSAIDATDDEPDFSPLNKDFEILGQSQSSAMSIVNGDFSKKTEWTLTLTPKKSGTLLIPPISFGKDKSQPIALLVNEAASNVNEENAELFLEVEAQPKKPYVQAQVILTVKLFRRVNISQGDLSEPNNPDALIERLEEGPHYTAARGQYQYAVIERKYAVFPQKSGNLKIDPVVLTAQVANAGRSRFNSYFNQSSKTIRIQSKALELEVQPIPSAFKGKHWLPAESLQLAQSWPKVQLKAGDPITHTVRLQAQAATIGLLPELNGNLQAIPDFKLYPDQPVMNEIKKTDGISSSREEKTALIPSRAGSYKIPALEIPWWNVKTDQMEIARLPEQVLNVEASGEPAASPAPEPVMEQTANPASIEASKHESNPGSSSLWLSIFLGAGWLATLLIWYFKNRQAAAVPAVEIKTDWRLNDLKKACSNNDSLLARQLLTLWMQSSEFVHGDEDALQSEIERLNRSIYGQGSKEWDGKALLRLIEALEESKHDQQATEALKPMYKI